MIEVGSRKRNQPAPPWVVFETLTRSHLRPTREWLILLDDEQDPQILVAETPSLVVWSSLWPQRPDARIRFDLSPDDAGSGTTLRWTLSVDAPMPDDSSVGHFRRRINELINGELRFSFGQ